jgi:DegV family protein with EDD domain
MARKDSQVSPAPAASLVRVVTDSTASLPSVPATGFGPIVVPLTVFVPEGPLLEGSQVSPTQVGKLLSRGEHLSTSQPSPEAFAVAYTVTPDIGAIVSVHLSSALSGTAHAAEQAAKRTIVPVTVVNSQSTGMGLGFAALAAAQCAAAKQNADHVAARAREVAASAKVRFFVDSLSFLRKGGRISAGTAAFGTALGVRPILEMRDGKVALAARVRTRTAALERLVAMAVADSRAMVHPVYAVQHLDAEDRAARVVEKLAQAVGVEASDIAVSPLSAVLGAHVGPGAIAVVVADWGNHTHN